MVAWLLLLFFCYEIDFWTGCDCDYGGSGGWFWLWWRVGMVVGYICSWGVVFVAVGEEKGTRGKREREDYFLFYFIKLFILFY